MLFSSMTFLWIFLPIVFVGGVLIKSEFQNIFLVLASLIFYAWGEPRYVFLMMFSIIINWLLGLAIERFENRKKQLLTVSIIVNLAVIGYYKYYTFLAESINVLIGRELIPMRDISLPIGISFFTFQIMSYMIDLYRGQYKAQKNIINLALYISFFPQLIAGPIVKYRDINEQIEHRSMTIEKTATGLRRFSYGLGKKLLIANILAECVDSIYNLDITQIGTGAAWIAAILYTLQIYYDFSGYSDMAIGLGKMFGFDFLENFDYPYLSKSIHEFWQRWHMSLGTWFKEYLYIPLGGNRKGTFRTYINLSIVFLLTGLWHGASWNFVFWGVYHGFFQILERLGLGRIKKKTSILQNIYTMLVVIVGWVFFRVEDIAMAIRLVVRMLMPWRHPEISGFDISRKTVVVAVFAVLGAGMQQLVARRYDKVSSLWKNSVPELIFCIAIMVLSFMLLASDTYNPFIYFRF